jgi:hypothetical protein
MSYSKCQKVDQLKREILILPPRLHGNVPLDVEIGGAGVADG